MESNYNILLSNYFGRPCLFFFNGLPSQTVVERAIDRHFVTFRGGKIKMEDHVTKKLQKEIAAKFSGEDPDRLQEAIMHCGLNIPQIAAYLHKTRGEP